MGYYVSNMFGIRTGGVFSGDVDAEDVRARVAKIVLAMREDATAPDPDLGDKDGDPSHCMSKELTAHKGSYIVIAGVFNYWHFEASSEFARRLSDEFKTWVMHMCWDEEQDFVECQIWRDGKPARDIEEGPIRRALSRVGSGLT